MCRRHLVVHEACERVPPLEQGLLRQSRHGRCRATQSTEHDRLPPRVADHCEETRALAHQLASVVGVERRSRETQADECGRTSFVVVVRLEPLDGRAELGTRGRDVREQGGENAVHGLETSSRRVRELALPRRGACPTRFRPSRYSPGQPVEQHRPHDVRGVIEAPRLAQARPVSDARSPDRDRGLPSTPAARFHGDPCRQHGRSRRSGPRAAMRIASASGRLSRRSAAYSETTWIMRNRVSDSDAACTSKLLSTRAESEDSTASASPPTTGRAASIVNESPNTPRRSKTSRSWSAEELVAPVDRRAHRLLARRGVTTTARGRVE